MKQSGRKANYRPVAAMMTIVLLLGCGWWFRGDLRDIFVQDKQDDALAALLDDPLADKEITLTVLQSAFSSQSELDTIKKSFIIRHPSVTIGMIGVPGAPVGADYAKAFIEAMDKSKPDVIALPFELYSQVAAEGRLRPLDAVIKQNKFDLDSFHQPLIDQIRAAGGGQLYGLPTSFHSTALYVNRELFEKENIPLPEEGASLDDILDTAARFAGTGISGLTSYSIANPADMAELIGQSSGLQDLSLTADGVKASVRTDGWNKVWQQVAEGYRSGWIRQSQPLDWSKGGLSMNEIMGNDLFATGKAAMSINDDGYYGNLLDYETNDKNKMDWSVQTFRLDPSATNQAQYLSTSYVYAISADTMEGEAAWELLRFIAGPEMAARFDMTGSNFNRLQARPAAMKSQPAEHWEAFYKMGADPAQAAAEIGKQTDSVYVSAMQQLSALAGEQMKAVIDNKSTVDQALERFQASLEKAIADASNKRGDGP